MSQQITEAFVQAFADNFLHLVQQKTSRLEKAVLIESGIKGTSKSVNRLGQRTAQRRTNRHAPTPINEQPHSTRFVDLFDWDDGDMIDDQDKIRMLVDPQSDYVNSMIMGLNRAKDDVIIAALGGNSRSSAGNVALPAGQKIAVGGTGLTKAKIIQARALFRKNEADEDEELYFTYSDRSMQDILTDTTLTSSDFMAVKMLQEGNVSQKWLGFNWIPTQRTPVASTTRYNYAWAKSGMVLGVGENIVTRVAEDPSHGYNVRPYAKMSIGSVRVEEEKVVEIACNEP